VAGTAAHHLTIDVEEIFHSTLLTERVPASTWDGLPRRAPAVTDWILEEMAAAGARGTFFTLGWLAEREPNLVRRISDAGHEIAAHSWWHRKVTEMTPDAFREDARRTKGLLEEVSGQEVVGFRAPSFSIRPGFEWAFDALLEEGYRYDSSLFPIRMHPNYGYPAADPDPFWIERDGGSLLEFPLLTLSLAGGRLPAAGGAYLRFFPYMLPARALAQAARRSAPGTLYVHPWDLDPEALRVALPRLTALRLYGGSRLAQGRLRRLLRRFRFAPLGEAATAMAGRREPS
jgi:polysaccharide deacetylase family protein (PEP-CTERM system associated)